MQNNTRESTEIRAVVYARVSTGDQAENGTSLPEQLVLCRRKIAEMGGQVVAEYDDPGISGVMYLTRPGLQNALRDIEQGKANALIIAKLDRTGRDVDVIRAIRNRVTAAGARLIFADGMTFENNATGKLMFTQLAGFAEFEKELIRERTMAGRANRAKQGIQPYRSFSPYGYYLPTKADVLSGLHPPGSDGQYIIVEDQAKWVREIFARYAAGSSLRQVARWLQEQGVPTPRNRPFWQAGSLQGILENPTYKGEPAVGRHSVRQHELQNEGGYRRGVTMTLTDPATWIHLSCEPLVEEYTWATCNERLHENRAMFGGNSTYKHLLSGLMRCPTCRRPMIAHGRTDGTRGGMYYHCRYYSPSQHPLGHSCTKTCHAGTKVEPVVLAGVLETASRPEAIEYALRAYQVAPQTDAADNTRQRLETALQDVDRRERAIAQAQIDAITKGRETAVYDAMLGELTSERANLRSKLTSEPEREDPVPDPKTAGEIAAEYLDDLLEVLTSETLTRVEKRAALARVIREIVPEGAGYRIYWRPFRKGASAVSNISTLCLAHCIRVEYIPLERAA